ncbi:unnamed protein product [Lactuca virosa]|uniref:Uncharacterized protein n=1 Tax=Lactuca virosa TaxID=75947 RepID=A0AAU9MND9_9ASTR|nr:unnamed protein product [Lactuca virosa]
MFISFVKASSVAAKRKKQNGDDDTASASYCRRWQWRRHQAPPAMVEVQSWPNGGQIHLMANAINFKPINLMGALKELGEE